MSRSNSFAPPLSPDAEPLSDAGDGLSVAERLHRIADARRGVELALCVNLFALAFAGGARPGWMLLMAGAALAIRAVLTLRAALQDPPALWAASVLAMLLPVVNLVLMAILCGRATRCIQAHAIRLPAFDPLRR